MNFIDAKLVDNGGKYAVEFGNEKVYTVELPESKVNDAVKESVGKEVILGVRPEHLHDEEMFLSAATTGVVDCDVDVTEMMGAETYLYLTLDGINLDC